MRDIKISLSIFSLQRAYGDMEALRIAKESGADAVDFNTDEKNRFDYRNAESVYSRSDEEIVRYFSGIKAYADQLGICICMTHGRLAGFKNDPDEDEALIENIRRDLLAAKTLGAPVCVIHAVSTMHMGPDCDPELMHQLNFDMYTRVLPFARQYGVKIATETFGAVNRYRCCDFFGNMNEFIKSYQRVCENNADKDYFTVCVDTGHTNTASRFHNNPSPGDAIRMLGKNTSVLHLHDNDTYSDQHKIPLTGSIDWEDVFGALDEIGYDGYYNLELTLSWFGNNFMKESAAFAVKMMRNYISSRKE